MMKGLMICNRVRLPYRVMRCMSEVGVKTHVLGNRQSKGLKFSRSCEKFTLARSEFNGNFNLGMAAEVNEYCAEHDIDLVFPGCALSSRSFHGMKPWLNTLCFPGPDLDQFDLLNNKWKFMAICLEEGILCPKTSLLNSRRELEEGLTSGVIKTPTIVKPLDMDGERGVLKLTPENYRNQLKKVTYSPILVQEFIEGEDIGASMYCKKGEVLFSLTHHLKNGLYKTFSSPSVLESIEKLASKLELDGVYNFDMRLDPKGSIFFLECNPRFFFKMPFSFVAGMNFALPEIVSDLAFTQVKQLGETLTRTPRAWPSMFWRPRSMSERDKTLTRFLLSDPISFARELVHLDWD
jgi:biotin carboxylase